MIETFMRAFPLDDIVIRSGGDGRTVEAYAAVFDTPTQISDQWGRYLEQIGRAAFNKTVADRGTRFGVFYNHGKTLYGTPSDRGSVPIGTPVEAPRADGKGLVTVTRYNRTPLADEVLEAIRNGDITGQSFTGRVIASDVPTPRGGFRPAKDGTLTLVTRTEIALSEYGPTPIPAYDVPMVSAIRSLTAHLGSLSDEDRAELASMLSLATPLPLEPAERSDTSTIEAVTEEPPPGHSGRSLSARIRAGMIARGI